MYQKNMSNGICISILTIFLFEVLCCQGFSLPLSLSSSFTKRTNNYNIIRKNGLYTSESRLCLSRNEIRKGGMITLSSQNTKLNAKQQQQQNDNDDSLNKQKKNRKSQPPSYTYATSFNLNGPNGSNGSSYVPSGLTKEQYDKIKRQEQEKESKMNYSMWGPRFRQIKAPTDDWMVMPSLWTGGFNSNNNKNKNGISSTNQNNGSATQLQQKLRTLCIRFMSFLKKIAPAYIIAYALTDVLLSGYTMLRVSSMTKTSMIGFMIRFMIWQRQQNLWITFWKVRVIKTLCASLLIPPFTKFIEHMNRRWLWSPKRTVLSSIGIFSGALVLWGLIITTLLPFIR